jgi:6-phosphofructokinase 2
MAEERGGRTALDADGPVVEAVLASGVRPRLLKINEHELDRLMHRPVEGEAAALEAARQLHRRSQVERVVVTLGAGGAVAVSAEGEFRVSPPDVEVVSAVGAGDAFLAGLMYGLVKEQGWEQALALAAAAGAAACVTPGTLLCQGADVWRLLPGARVERARVPAGAR